MIRLTSLILAIVFALTGTGAAQWLHEANEHGAGETNVTSPAVSNRPSAGDAAHQHDESKCAICAAIHAASFAVPESATIPCIAGRLIERQLAIDDQRLSALCHGRPSCRDPPVV